MKRLGFFLLLIILIISGCSQNTTAVNRNFKGESEHWMGLYQVVGNNFNQVSIDKLIYKGSDLGSVGKVKYSFKSDADLVSVSGEELLFKDRGYIMHQGGGNGAVIPAKETIEVTVEWNGKIEKFNLNPTGPIQM